MCMHAKHASAPCYSCVPSVPAQLLPLLSLLPLDLLEDFRVGDRVGVLAFFDQFFVSLWKGGFGADAASGDVAAGGVGADVGADVGVAEMSDAAAERDALASARPEREDSGSRVQAMVAAWMECVAFAAARSVGWMLEPEDGRAAGQAARAFELCEHLVCTVFTPLLRFHLLRLSGGVNADAPLATVYRLNAASLPPLLFVVAGQAVARLDRQLRRVGDGPVAALRQRWWRTLSEVAVAALSPPLAAGPAECDARVPGDAARTEVPRSRRVADLLRGAADEAERARERRQQQQQQPALLPETDPVPEAARALFLACVAHLHTAAESEQTEATAPCADAAVEVVRAHCAAACFCRLLRCPPFV